MNTMRLVSLGDSFTEGVGDELADGRVRGWADLVAARLAAERGVAIQYANLAIRGRLIEQIVAGQLEPALALKPTILTFNGGGNDMLRPRADLQRISALAERVITRCLDEDVRLVILSGANPSRNLPMGRRIQRLGDQLTAVVTELAARYDVAFANVWADAELTRADYWSEDRLHLNPAGHRRAAAHVLDAIGVAAPAEWTSPVPLVAPPPGLLASAGYYRRFVIPWIHRRLTGRSSGDGRQAKYAQWHSIEPAALD